jgi:putative heme-binding domain-containing protein
VLRIEGNDTYAKDFLNMLKNHPETQSLHYALMLKNAKSGWSEKTVLSYYAWLNKARSKSGGRSYKGFIENIRKEALDKLTEPLKKVAASAPQYKAAKEPVITAEGPGRNWDLKGALAATTNLSKADIANGKRMFQAALCSRCHSMAGAGGNSGPELTNIASRFTTKDVLKAILDPSEVISEQYHFSQFDLKDGSSTRGKVMQEDDSHLSIAMNPFDLTQVIKLKKSEIKKISHSPVSPMPPATINTLNPDELRDLMLYLTKGN